MNRLARFLSRRSTRPGCATRPFSAASTASTTAGPLRILFCGSDAFSIACLEPLARILRHDSHNVQSIDVLCRTDKMVGRGLKTLSEVPIKNVAKNLSLPVHQIDSFAQLDRSKLSDVNLVIAVSFGLLIPASIISLAKFGGLNVHPSLLPDLRGAAPIHHTLLLNRPFTGVSVQTLHPTKFDHGLIVAQTPLPGIPVPAGVTHRGLTAVLSAEASRLLEGVVRSRSFLDPTPVAHSKETIRAAMGGQELARAPKVTKADSMVDWQQMTTPEILRRLRVFGGVWDDVLYRRLGGLGSETRVVYKSLRAIPTVKSIPPGTPFLDGNSDVAVRTVDGAVQVVDCTISGGESGGAGVRELAKRLGRLR